MFEVLGRSLRFCLKRPRARKRDCSSEESSRESFLKENKIRHIEELGFTTGTFVTILEAQLYGKEEDTDWTREPEAIQAYVCVCASRSPPTLTDV